MNKTNIILIIFLSVTYNLFSQVQAPVSVNETRPTMKTDTIIEGSHIFLTRTFLFGADTLVVEASYKYTPKDFSFYYQELEERVVVTLNGEVLKANNENHLPTIHAFPEKEIFGERITANDMDYLILLGKEFYCDGKQCANLFALVVNMKTHICLDINTGFYDAKEILHIINKRSKENDKVQVPVISNCKKESAADAIWINVDKAL